MRQVICFYTTYATEMIKPVDGRALTLNESPSKLDSPRFSTTAIIGSITGQISGQQGRPR